MNYFLYCLLLSTPNHSLNIWYLVGVCRHINLDKIWSDQDFPGDDVDVISFNVLSWKDIYLRHPFEDDEICQSKGKEGKEAGQSVDKWYVRLY